MSRRQQPFFVGYLAIPTGLRGWLGLYALIAFASFVVTALAVGLTQDNPGDGRAMGRQTVQGVIEPAPYPILHVTQGNDQIAAGDTLMLSGAGKFGVQDPAAPLLGRKVEVTGVVLQRGTIRMLQVGNPRRNLTAVDGAPQPPVPIAQDLGRWRLAGEICDGKCLAGAMRPGRGIAHKACAELCIDGGVPPVFVTTQPVEGHEFLMIGSHDGGPVPDALLDQTAVFVSVEGKVELRGGLAVFLVDPDTIEILQ
ncbi:MAG: hypothetical protein AAGA28_05155 [Pseudomonadota bacterium]